MMPRSLPPIRLLAIIAIVAAIGLVAGLLSFGPSGSGQAQQKPGAAPPAPPVTVSAPLKREITDWNEFTGQFAPVDYVEVRARVSGYLTEVDFTDGQMVQKGDLLFVIDPRPFEIALASARARLDQATSSREFASRQLGRADELKRRDFTPQSLLDQRQSESKGAGAALDAARAAVREAELNLQFTRVTAPVAGRVSARQISIGNLVSAGGGGGNSGGGTLLTTIVSQDPLYFNFDMSEAEFLAFQRWRGSKSASGGEMAVPVQLRQMDQTDWTLQGELTFIDNQVDRTSGTIRARATLANPEHLIAPGSFGRIRMPSSAPYEALLVPDTSVVTDQNRKILLTVAPDGTVVPKPVTVGPLSDGLRVVRSGITAEDQVIVNGIIRARPGAKVTAQPGSIGGQPQPAAAPAAGK
ncbi:MAG: efflux RND transporter periplasmic adaptor subunit [Solirubrobacterales bacterium]